MANIIQYKLDYLEETKRLIQEAIAAKGVSVSDTDTFRSYADKISSIQSGGSIAGAPSGIKFGYSTFTTVPAEIIPYLEAQTDLTGIFQRCQNLTTVALFDTSKCTTMERTFYNCQALKTIAQLDTNNVINMKEMFYYCRNLTTVPLFDTSKCTTMERTFEFCFSLTSVPQFDTSSVTNMDFTFHNCSTLETVPLLNFSNVTDNYNMFNNCTSLTNLGGFTGWKLGLNLKYSSLLTIDSVMNIINNAIDMTSNPQTLTLHKNVFNKLSAEQIATASAKGWNIASA